MSGLKTGLVGMVAAATMVLPALAQQMPPPTTPTMMTASPADKALTSSMDRMNSGLDQSMSGNADQDFTMMMMAHHRGAVEMAKVELQYGRDPEMRRMAQNIITTQAAEIKQMQAWQAKHPAQKAAP